MPFSLYIYESLQHTSEIRLLKLPEKPVDLRNFTIDHVLLTNRPKYHAVSYTWGDQVPYKSLVLNQTSYLKITASLWAAIRVFAQYFAGEYLWIDQICINQGLRDEKRAQVAMMTAIYAQSESTVAWLGEEDGTTAAAFSFVNFIGTLDLSLHYSDYALSHQEIREKLIATHATDLLPLKTDKRWHALMEVFHRPWFTRLWTLQEVVVPEEVVFFCGRHSCAQKSLYQAGLLIGHEHPIEGQWPSGIPSCRIANRYRTYYRDQRGTSLLSLLLNTVKDFQCSEPRDKVFALLGLQSRRLRLPIPADYKISEADVYTNCARVMINQSSFLQVLTVSFGRSSGVVEGLPFWVPDWTALPTTINLDYSDPNTFKFHACGPLQHRDSPRESQATAKHLLVTGKVLDNIRTVLGITFEDYHSMDQKVSSFERLVRQVLKLQFPPFKVLTRVLELASSLSPIVKMGYIAKCELLLKLVRTVTVDGLVRESYYKTLGWPGTDWSDKTVLKMLDALGAVSPDSTFRNLSFGPELKDWLDKLVRQLAACSGRRIVMLKNNQIGLCPDSCQEGDSICVLHGANLPIVLRKHDDKYEIIGPCFVDGIMYGEAVGWREDEAETFTLV